MGNKIRFDDATEGALYLSRSLEQKLPGALRRRYRNLVFSPVGGAESPVPQQGDMAMGAKTITEEIVNEVGETQTIAGADGIDITTVEVSVDEDRYKGIVDAVCIKYTVPELNAMDLARANGQVVVNINDERLRTAVRVLNEKAHKRGAFGDAARSMTGFFNDANITGITPTANIYTSGTPAEDALGIFRDVNSAFGTESDETFLPNLVYCTRDYHDVLTSSYRSTNVDVNAKNNILESFPNIVDIRILPECKNSELIANGVLAGGSTKERMVFLEVSDEVLRRKFFPIQQLPPQLHGMVWKVYLYMGYSEVMIRQPKGMRYVDVEKK